jgi:hypothetical protein
MDASALVNETEGDSNDDEEDHESQCTHGSDTPLTNGVFWNESAWDVDDDCCKAVIPLKSTNESEIWKRRRLENKASVDCAVSGLCACGSDLAKEPRLQVGTIKVHTNIGTQQRTIYQTSCRCGNVHKWDPSTEFIHTINHQKHGSELLHVIRFDNFFVTLILFLYFILTVGHEVIYAYLNHILGVAGQFSGVGMHIGHFASQFRTTTSSTISNTQMRRLLHTGITLWLRGFSMNVLRPCCDLKFIGGDGTVIGIPTPNIPDGIRPVWHPQRLREPSFRWSLHSRQPLSKAFALANINDKERAQYLNNLRNMLSPRKNEAARRNLAAMLTRDNVLQRMSSELATEFVRWLKLPTMSLEFEPLEQVFMCLFSQGSLTGLFPVQLATVINENLKNLLSTVTCRRTIERLSVDYAFGACGIGVEIIDTFRAQVSDIGHIRPSTIDMLHYFSTLALELHESVPINSSDPESMSNPWCSRPDPSTTGIRYFVTEHGRSLQSSWALSDVAISKVTQAETSCDGCTKKRPMYFAHTQRTSIWINLCMIHEQAVGFHLIHSQEGRRDALIPVYRFWDKPPLAIWNDFGCGCEESGLNWLPEYFHDIQHFHDMFHGFSHTSCSEKFSSRRLPKFAALNTSLMEQVSLDASFFLRVAYPHPHPQPILWGSFLLLPQFNSFIQPIRTIVKSRTTKLETLMFWMEVFVAEWNRRKSLKIELHEQFAALINVNLNHKRKVEDEENLNCTEE